MRRESGLRPAKARDRASADSKACHGAEGQRADDPAAADPLEHEVGRADIRHFVPRGREKHIRASRGGRGRRTRVAGTDRPLVGRRKEPSHDRQILFVTFRFCGGQDIRQTKDMIAGFVHNPLNVATDKLLVPAVLSIIRECTRRRAKPDAFPHGDDDVTRAPAMPRAVAAAPRQGRMGRPSGAIAHDFIDGTWVRDRHLGDAVKELLHRRASPQQPEPAVPRWRASAVSTSSLLRRARRGAGSSTWKMRCSWRGASSERTT